MSHAMPPGATRRTMAAVALLLAAAACAPARVPVQYYPDPTLPGEPARPFSTAVRVGDLLILAGQLGTDSTGRLAPGGIEGETRQTLENIRAALQRAGSSMDRVVKCTALLADIDEFARMNAVYRTFFDPERLPARTTFAVAALARGARVEIECWAAR